MSLEEMRQKMLQHHEDVVQGYALRLAARLYPDAETFAKKLPEIVAGFTAAMMSGLPEEHRRFLEGDLSAIYEARWPEHTRAQV